jgi:hypothetical protein
MKKCHIFTPSSLVINRGVLSEIMARVDILENKKNTFPYRKIREKRSCS